MSGVVVLVGTCKGAFVMTSDAMPKQWEIAGALTRLGDIPSEGISSRPRVALRLPVQRFVWATDTASP
jgi:hypothetical protein